MNITDFFYNLYVCLYYRRWMEQARITPYEGLNLANQNNRKLEVFGRKLEETCQNCIDILINISENETILFN